MVYNKQFNLVILSLISLIILVTCGGGEVVSSTTNSNIPDTSNTIETNPQFQQPTGTIESTVSKIRNRGYILAGVKHDFKPFGFKDETDQVVGFDVDIMREFAKRWLNDETKVEFIQVTSNDRIPRLAAGKVDLVVASMTHKRERDELIDFSQPYFLDGQSLLVRENSGINSVADLDGKVVTAIEGSTSIDNIQAEAARLGINITILEQSGYPQAIEAVNAGLADALTTDSVALAQFAQDNPGLVVVGQPFTSEPYGIGVPQGDSDFRELVDYTLQDMKRDGTYDQLYKKWFGQVAHPYQIELLPGKSAYQSFADYPEQITIPETSKINKILTDEKIVVGVKYDFKPFGYQDETGEVIGFDVDIVKEFARRWLGDENAFELVRVTSDDRIPKVAMGEIDFAIASMTYKRDRAETIDFSQTYFLDGQSLLVRRDSGIKDIHGLDGKKVAAIQGSTSIDQIKAYAAENSITIEVIPYLEYPPGIQSLIDGNVDALTTDSVALSQFALDNPELVVVGGRFTSEPYGIGLPQNDYRFRELVNFTLQEMKRDGTYNEIYKKWFGDDEPYQVTILPGDADYLGIEYQDLGRVKQPPSLDGVGANSTIGRIKARGKLIAGVKYDFAPFGFLDNKQKLVGFDVDLIQAIADMWGVGVEFKQVTSADRILKLERGEVDIVAASMTHKKERDETIDFSQTYFLDGQSLLVRGDSDIQGITDLDGKSVGAIEGSTSIGQIEAYAQANGVSIEILPFSTYPQAVEVLKQGIIDALTTDSGALSQFAKDNPELVVVGEKFTQEPYGFGLPPGDSYFNNLVNFTLQDLEASGKYAEIYHKWFGDTEPPFDIETLPGDWPYTFASSPDQLDKPTKSKVDDIFTRGSFIAGVKYDFKPFGYLENNQVVGFDVDLMREFAKRWLGDPEAVVLVEVTSENRIEKLVAGEVDIVAASMTHKRERDELIDFSQTYFLDGQSILVRRVAGINQVADLNGKQIAAISGSTSIEQIEAYAAKNNITIDVVTYTSYPPALNDLKAGKVNALTTDSVALNQFAQDNSELVVIGEPFTEEPYGLGLPNFDDRFQDLVNFTLQEMKRDGTYDRLYRKWFGADSTPFEIEYWPGWSYFEVNFSPMVKIPAGEFIRGRDNGLNNEGPAQTITLDEFYIDQYEVTNHQYAQCVQAAWCANPRLSNISSFAEYYAQLPSHPVVGVSWDDAQDYCEFMGKRLPTEAEWEKAARGTDGRLYPWGDNDPTDDLANVSPFSRGLAQVGSFPDGASPYGVFDMSGNVREWVADWYADFYYQESPRENPKGPEQKTTKTVRGGAYNEGSFNEVSTVRRKGYRPDPSVYDPGMGFRCAASSFPEPK